MDNDEDGTKRNPATGSALGALSAAKNKKLMAGIGAALLIIGIAGMIVIGAGGLATITSGGFSSPDEGKSLEMTEYVFLFTLVAGLILLVYSLVGIQRDRRPRQAPAGDTEAA
ncbi:MAG TPA: hypothetical protein VJP79_00180 [Nitrososphaera sp.]|jgi:hypothetical protein|nr:hypothetical protein [Nitrososphaera sp.]